MKVHPTARTPVLAQAINKDFFFGELGWRVLCRDAATTAVATPDDPPKKGKPNSSQTPATGEPHHRHRTPAPPVSRSNQCTSGHVPSFSSENLERSRESAKREEQRCIRAGWVPFGCG